MTAIDTLSLAICTYNRASSLCRTLRSLKEQRPLDGFDWELLLVDNNSSDNTREVAERFAAELPIRYLFEPVQGLSTARNRALKEHRGSTLIFTDDDVVMDPRWLSSYAEAISNNVEAQYFGGRILPLWNSSKPGWLTDPALPLVTGLLVQFDLGADNRWLGVQDPTPYGASFALRRGLTEQMGLFRAELGVHGSRPGRGEEAEYLGRARDSGAKGFYVGRAECYHVQDPARFRLPYLYRYGIEKGRAAALMGSAGNGHTWRQGQFLAKGLLQLLKGRGDRFRQCVINMGIQRGLAMEQRR